MRLTADSSRQTLILSFVAACALALTGSAASATDVHPSAEPRFALLDEPIASNAKTTEQQREAVVRSRAVTIHAADLAQAAVGDAVLLNLFDDVSLKAVIDSTWTCTLGMDHWKGHIDGFPRSSVLLVMKQQSVAGIIRVPGTGAFRIRTSPVRGPVVEEIEDAAFPPCGNTPAQAIHLDPAQPDGAAQGGIAGPPPCSQFIDVMIVYTPEARDLEGGDAPIQALAGVAIDESNVAYFNSAINPRVRLVFAGLTDYPESGSFFTDLARLQDPGDGFMDEVHPLRDQYGADLVDLLISNTQGGTICGLGYLMIPVSPGFAVFGFSVCNTGCTAGGYTLPHELGHNMGCAHDFENSGGPGAFSFSYGWRFNGSDGEQYRTVMAYAPGNRIPHFSNPNITYLDTPTGVPAEEPNAADNAKTINLTAPTVAAFRGSVGTGQLVWPNPGTAVQGSDVSEGDNFGVSVAISGELAIVGAYNDDINAGPSNAGAAYIYRLNSETGLWGQEARLTAPDGQMDDRFGVAVDVFDDPVSGTELAVIGAYLDDDNGRNSGSAYIFRSNGSTWSFDGKVKPLDPFGGDLFGTSVSVGRGSGGDVVVVGSYLDDDNGGSSGSAYVFRKSGGSWVQEAKLKAVDAAAGDQFGNSVAYGVAPVTGGEYVVAGAWLDDSGSTSNAGSAYVFQKNGATWVQIAKLAPTDPAADDQFGYSVSLSFTDTSKVAIIGAWRDDGIAPETGSAYVFRDAGSGWNQESKLTSTDPAENDTFGCSVSISGDRAIVGAYLDDSLKLLNTGAAYVFHYNGASWAFESKIVALDAGADDDFGFSVGIDGHHAVIGSWQDDNNGEQSGSVYFTDGSEFTDCNNNGSPDDCDIQSGISIDADGNGIPDECEGPSCPPDITGNGVVNIDDLLAVINTWGACPGCPTDIAPPGGNGVVNIDDLLAIVNAWGNCP